jgi:SAM-dependent methyltransferase
LFAARRPLTETSAVAPLYDDDLAFIHHHGYAGFIHRAAPALLATMARAGLEGGTVVDLGCGSGIWLRLLGERGYRAIGVDQSAAMLRLARQQAPSATLKRGSAFTTAIPACHVVTALGEPLAYLPVGRVPPMSALFTRIAAALRPGGLFIFDLLVKGAPRMRYRTWTAGEDWACMLAVTEDETGERLVREITTFRRHGTAGYRRDVEHHRLRVVSRAAVVADLRAAGFRVTATRRYGESTLAPRRMAFFARKPGGTGVKSAKKTR